MKKLFLLLLIPFLCSCSQKAKEELVIEPQIATLEAVPAGREAVFTYGEVSQDKTIRLTFSSEPSPLREGYVKLVGVIAGDNPLACLEVSGRGMVVGCGESVDAYVVSKINNEEVLLCLKK